MFIELAQDLADDRRWFRHGVFSRERDQWNPWARRFGFVIADPLHKELSGWKVFLPAWRNRVPRTVKDMARIRTRGQR